MGCRGGGGGGRRHRRHRRRRPPPAAAAAVQTAEWGPRLAATLDRARCLGLPPLAATLVGTATHEAVRGTVHLTPSWMAPDDTVAACVTRVAANVTGLPPGTAHGFHIHTYGDATTRDGKSAGGHYDRDPSMTHGLPLAAAEAVAAVAAGHKPVRHEGDMGNVRAAADGGVFFSRLYELVVLEHVVGRSIILHQAPDDGGQPTGNAGARVAQGVIGYKLVPKAKVAPPPTAGGAGEGAKGGAAGGGGGGRGAPLKGEGHSPTEGGAMHEA
ncbi:hypothetical protein BU14_0022s0075 [Porphyra umbilicalis]|uniref:Superoxide dismutase copper/zinc binding domain-containing protein n=1 Tax=Porphyra umbilicalis TaxID=2786 RepID=A0A1X6PKM5_PORUM|nr:hypothetical protein BU14_0022s0075 [Porphyra umbilicalis]|eukprot:OSX81355.1 hypothetical protein BU14_0022s0075 [Porphyra umbilicalis]